MTDRMLAALFMLDVENARVDGLHALAYSVTDKGRAFLKALDDQ